MHFRVPPVHKPCTNMSTQTLDRLSDTVRKLVLVATKDAGSSIFGVSEKDEIQVQEWIEKIADGSITEDSNLKVLHFPPPFIVVNLSCRQVLDSHLISRTFLVSNYLTAADIALYGTLHPVLVGRLCI